MQHFMDYFGGESGFLGSLIIYFPLAVIIFSLLVTTDDSPGIYFTYCRASRLWLFFSVCLFAI